MNIQNLVREKIVANIKIGMKGPNGLPKKLPNFNVEEDKATSKEMVEVFKKVYPGKPTKLQIRFTTEEPFNFKYKRYVNSKAVCIGNGTNAITIGKDSKGNNSQVTVACSEECEHRLSGKCKLVGSLKFVLDGINAGGLWKINTSGGLSLSNIASEIVKYKKAGMSIVGVPFELSLTPQESLAYGTYYSLDLKRTDIKPEVVDVSKQLSETAEQNNKVKQLVEKKETKSENEITAKTKLNEESKVVNISNKVGIEQNEKTVGDNEKIENKQNEEQVTNTEKTEEFSDYLTLLQFMPTMIKNKKFDKFIFVDINNQNVEYILHPNADAELLTCGEGTIIKVISSKIEAGNNILCKYEIKQKIQASIAEFNKTLEEAV